MPQFTGTEFDSFRNAKLDDPKFLETMQEKGIEFDTGPVEVFVDGESKKMVTDKSDFGTVIDE